MKVAIITGNKDNKIIKRLLHEGKTAIYCKNFQEFAQSKKGDYMIVESNTESEIYVMCDTKVKHLVILTALNIDTFDWMQGVKNVDLFKYEDIIKIKR